MKIDSLICRLFGPTRTMKLKFRWYICKQKCGLEPIPMLTAKNSYIMPQTSLRYYED